MSYRRDRDPWSEFAGALNSCERELNDLRYEGALKPPPPTSSVQAFFSGYRNLPRGTIALGQIQLLLKGDAVAPPHGVDLLKPLPIPEFPKLPVRPESPKGMPQTGWSLFSRREPQPPAMLDLHKMLIERAKHVQSKYQQMHAELETQFKKDAEQLASLRKACATNDPEAMRLLMLISHLRHPLPESFVSLL